MKVISDTSFICCIICKSSMLIYPGVMWKRDSSQTKDLKERQRKRDEHFVQRSSASSHQLITERNIDVSNAPWSELETLLFESMINAVKRKSDGDVLSSDVSYFIKTVNSLCDLVNCRSLPLPFNGKTIKQFEGKLKHLIQQTTLFRDTYMNQVAFNLSQ